jgi:hypothetical protein
MNKKYYPINEDVAKLAKEMNSFSSYEFGSTTKEYMRYVDEAYSIAEDVINYNEELTVKATELAELFSKRLADWFNKYSSIQSRCPSVMIAGPSKFPVSKKEKQNKAIDKHWELYREVMSIKDKIKNLPRTSNIIRSDDKDAVEKLNKKIKKLETVLNAYKEANKIYKRERKNFCTDYFVNRIEDEEKYPNLKELLKDEHFVQDINWTINNGYGCPAPSFTLTGIRNKIKNATKRIQSIEKMKTETVNSDSFYPEQNICDVVENNEVMRIQLIFDGKPSEEIRNVLKHNGFRWSPRFSAWQRQLTLNGRHATRQVLYDLINEEL